MKKLLLVLLAVFLLSISVGCSKNGTSSDSNGKAHGDNGLPYDGQ